MLIPSSLHRYFWNCRVEELDTETHKGTIISTLLEHGDIEAMRWMLRTYTQEEIVPIVQRSREVSPKSKSFWAVFFHIDLPDAHAREDTPWWNRARP